MDDYLILAVLIVIVGAASFYIWKAKKNGQKCIGCPDAKSCASKSCGGNCSACSGNCGSCGGK